MSQDAFRAYEAYGQSRRIAHQPFHAACYAPFVSLYFNTNGDVIACCKSSQYRLGNVAEERLPAIWSGERVKRLRDALQRDDFGVACGFCDWQVRSGHRSVHAKIFDELPAGTGDELWPARMDFTLSNTCNLACVMCYGVLSSTIRAERDQLPPLPDVYGEQFFSDLRPFLRRLTTATFMGGEPFLAEENFRIWDALIDESIPLQCHVITNGTIWNQRVERVMDALPMSISVSLDGVTRETVESIRVHARFETLMSNLARFREITARKGTRLSLMFCLMRQNRHEFGPYLRLAEEIDADVDMNVVVDPESCSLHSLEPRELLRIVAELESQDSREGFSRLTRNGATFTNVLADLRSSAMAAVGRPSREAAGAGEPATILEGLSGAWASVGRGEHREALAILRSVRANPGEQYEALLCAAHAHRGIGEFAQAESLLGEAIALWPRGARAFIARAWLRLERQQIEDAIADAERAKQSLANTGSAELRCAVDRLRATAYGRAGRHREALAIVRGLPSEGASAYEAATIEAWLCRESKLVAEAEVAVDRAIGIDGQRVQAFVERAWLRLAQGRHADGIAAARGALDRLRPDRIAFDEAGIRHVLALLCRAIGALDEAVVHARRLEQLRPGEAWTHVLLDELLSGSSHRTA